MTGQTNKSGQTSSAWLQCIEQDCQGRHPIDQTLYTCPDCGGALWELKDGNLIRYECHVGHVYTADGFEARNEEELESALWTALRALEERAALKRRMGARMLENGLIGLSDSYEAQAQEIETRADVIRNILVN